MNLRLTINDYDLELELPSTFAWLRRDKHVGCSNLRAFTLVELLVLIASSRFSRRCCCRFWPRANVPAQSAPVRQFCVSWNCRAFILDDDNAAIVSRKPRQNWWFRLAGAAGAKASSVDLSKGVLFSTQRQ